jgi:hypothetical protein
MSKYPPYIYEPDKSIEVLKKTEDFFKNNPDFKTKIEELGRVHHSIGNLIPQTTENFWSGHFFPYTESWDELQISFNLVLFGLYKQAFMSLRSGLELGLLSVYYNINDDGHRVVQDCLKSRDSWEANTPRTKKVWEILNSNENIKYFNNKLKLREHFDELSFLHNYVHTKGYKYSNHLGIMKSNFQTFEEKIFLKWLKTYQEIVIIITTLHLLKYPIGILKFDWSRKVGIDNPFPVLREFEVEEVERLLPKKYVVEINKIGEKDEFTQGLFTHITGLPDMTEVDVEEQIVSYDKMSIEHHPDGFIGWEKQEKDKMEKLTYDEASKKKVLDKIEVLRKWATENNFMKSRFKNIPSKETK